MVFFYYMFILCFIVDIRIFRFWIDIDDLLFRGKKKLKMIGWELGDILKVIF